MSLYDDLGVDAEADAAAITAAHRQAAKRHHPDRPGGDREKFEQISRAYLVLRDPMKRQRYDETGQVDDLASNDTAIMAELLTKAFDAAIERCGGDLDFTDIVAGMLRWFDGEIGRIAKDKAQAQAAHDRMSKALRKLKFKGTGADILRAVMADRLKMVTAAIELCEKQSTHMLTAKNRAADYSWDFETRWSQSGFGWETASTASSY